MHKFDLVSAGEVAIDVILAGVDKVSRSWSIRGRTRDAGIFAAGSAGYVAQCYSKLGGRCAVSGRIGYDNASKIVMQGLEECGVSTRYLSIDKKVHTEISTVLLYNDGNKTSINSDMPTFDSCFDLDFRTTEAFHIGGYLLFPNIWGRNIRRLLSAARREGVVVSLDPQMSATGEWSRPFEELFDQLDVLLLDETEARLISGRKRSIDAVKHLLEKGVGIVAVKIGRKGCVVGTKKQTFAVNAFESKTVSTIGAGDAFDAAFIYGVLKDWNLEETAQFANVVAGLSTTQLGCMTAIPRAGVARRLAERYYA